MKIDNIHNLSQIKYISNIVIEDNMFQRRIKHFIKIEKFSIIKKKINNFLLLKFYMSGDKI